MKFEVNTSVLLKTAGIFERALGKKIYVKLDGPPAVEQLSANAYMIHFLRKTDDPYYYRSFEHEISHIAFESNFRRLQVFLNQFKNMRKVAHLVYNALDDVRVDSLWNQIYPGSAQIRKKQLEEAAQHWRPWNDVLDVIPAAYFTAQGVDVHYTFFSPEIQELYEKVLEEFEKVKLKGPQAPFAAALRILTLLKPFLKKNQSQQSSVQSHQPNLSKMTAEDVIDGLEAIDPLTPEEVEELEKKIDVTLEVLSGSNRLSGTEDHGAKDATQADVKAVKKMLKLTLEEIDEIAEYEGEELVEQVKKKLRALGQERVDLRTKVYGRVRPFQFSSFKVSGDFIDKKLLVGLRRYFTRLALQKKQTLDEEGEEIDVEAYINFLRSTEKPVFISDNKVMGAYIGVLLDYSPSMSGSVGDLLRFSLTLQEALKGMPFKVVYYPFNGDKTTYISKVEDAHQLLYAHTAYYTPLPTAIMWAGFDVLQQPQDKKFLIILTDGLPEDNSTPSDVLDRWTYSAVQYLRRRGVKVFVLFIDPPDPEDYDVRKIFGADLMLFLDRKRFADTVIKFFAQMIGRLMEV